MSPYPPSAIEVWSGQVLSIIRFLLSNLIQVHPTFRWNMMFITTLLKAGHSGHGIMNDVTSVVTFNTRRKRGGAHVKTILQNSY